MIRKQNGKEIGKNNHSDRPFPSPGAFVASQIRLLNGRSRSIDLELREFLVPTDDFLVVVRPLVR